MPYMFGLSSQPSLDDSRAKALAALTLADEQLLAQLQGSCRDEPEGVLRAMLCRVRFRKALLQVSRFYMCQSRHECVNSTKTLHIFRYLLFLAIHHHVGQMIGEAPHANVNNRFEIASLRCISFMYVFGAPSQL